MASLPPTDATIGAEPTDIILLAFNRPTHLVRMVEAIEQRTRVPYRLTIVDNGSEADLRAWLHEQRDRFHQVVFNEQNLHLAGLQVGIERTASARYVVSDADLVPPDLGPDRCWLGELHALMDRHDDFGMVGCRIEGLPMPEWHRIGGDDTRVVDGELLEGPTGVWLNLIRRDALQVPFQSDGMTCHALSRAGYRVGVGVELCCEHLGDLDPEVYPDYLARKNSANGFRSVYVEYQELQRVERPPTLHECAIAAPLLADLRELGIAPASVLEVGTATSGPLVAAVEPAITALGLGIDDPGAWPAVTKDSTDVLAARSADAVLACMVDRHDPDLVRAAASATRSVLYVLTPHQSMSPPEGFELRERRPPNDIVLRMARWADRTARAMIGYTTLERRADWLELFEHARFGARSLRLYECRRIDSAPTGEPVELRCQSCSTDDCACGALRTRRGPRPYRRPFGRTLRGAIGAKLTQVVRAIGVEWRTRRSG